MQDWQSSLLASKLAATKLSSSSLSGAEDSPSLDTLMKMQIPEPIGLTKVDKSFHGFAIGNLLGVKHANVPKRTFDTATARYRASHQDRLLVTGVDKTLRTIDPLTGEVDQLFQTHKAAILTFAQHPIKKRYLLTGSMDATANLTDMITGAVVQTFKHSKFVVRCAFSNDGRWMATASYDRSIVLYEAVQAHAESSRATERPSLDDEDDAELAEDPCLRYEERHRVETKTNPEALEFHPDGTHLIYTLRSSHLLYYISLPSPASSDATAESTTGGTTEPPFSTSTKSFNPHPLDNHVSFSVLNLAIHPSGRIIACQTGDHAGQGGERILLYGIEPDSSGEERLAVLWTGEPGDAYVLPKMAWLPDGSGLVTTTTTGHLNLIDLNGKIRSKLKVHGEMLNGMTTSNIIRDLEVVERPVGEGEGHGGPGWQVISVGYDSTIKLSS